MHRRQRLSPIMLAVGLVCVVVSLVLGLLDPDTPTGAVILNAAAVVAMGVSVGLQVVAVRRASTDGRRAGSRG